MPEIPLPTLGRAVVPDDPRDLTGEFRFRRPIEVRFADTDAMGHVNNAVYLTYCESARASYYEAVTGRTMLGDAPSAAWLKGEHPETEDSKFILAEARVTYRSPAFFGEVLTIEVRASRIGRTSFTLEYRLTVPASPFGPARLVAVADSILVAYDYGQARPVSLPDELVASLEAFEGQSLRAT